MSKSEIRVGDRVRPRDAHKRHLGEGTVAYFDPVKNAFDVAWDEAGRGTGWFASDLVKLPPRPCAAGANGAKPHFDRTEGSRMIDIIRKLTLQRRCPYCRAQAGVRCKSKSGRYVQEHAPRVSAALPDIRREREKRQIQCLANRVFDGPVGERLCLRRGTLQTVFRHLAEFDHTLVQAPE